MANVYYQPGTERGNRVRDLFGRIASRYDFLNDLQSFGLHRRWKTRLVRMAKPQPGEFALDLCCGTGDITSRLANARTVTCGLDFSEAMLRQAQSRFGGLTLYRGDAQNLPFSDEAFHIVTIAYGLRNLADWRCGLREMWRVAKPGGRLLIMDFGRPANRVWRGCYMAYLRCAVPVMGSLFCGDSQAYAYILESLRHYPAQTGVSAELTAMGAVSVTCVNLVGGAMSIHMAVKP